LNRGTLKEPADAPPPAIALDTSFVVKVLHRRDPQHGRAYQLYRRLVEEETVCAVCWPVFQLEFWFAWDRAVRDLHPEELHNLTRELRATLTGQGELALGAPRPLTPSQQRAQRLREGERLLALLLRTLRVARIRLTNDLLATARELIVESGLKPLDAVICAVSLTVARVTGTPPSVASFDNDFRRAPGFEIWGLR
jgi:predicted nucleic acid-binding protein